MVGDCDTPGDEAGGSIAFARPKSSTFTGAVGPHLDVRRFQIAVNDPLLVRRFERLRDLLRDRQRFVDRDRPARDSLREVFALDQFHHESVGSVGLFQTVNGRNVLMVQGGEDFRFPLESGHSFRVGRERFGENLDGDVAIEPRVARAIHLPHAAGPQGGEDLVRAEAGARRESQKGLRWIIRASGTTVLGRVRFSSAVRACPML